MDTKTIIFLLLGILPAWGVGRIWSKKMVYVFYCLTDKPRLNITGDGFRIRKNWLWRTGKVQFTSLHFLFGGRKIGREGSSLIQAYPDLGGHTRDEYDSTHRDCAELNYDSENKKFYLERSEHDFSWRPLEASESDLRTFQGNRLYLDQNIFAKFGPLSLTLELVPKTAYNADAGYSSGFFLTFLVYQMYGLYVLFRSQKVSADSSLIIVSSVFLLGVMAWLLFHKCNENHVLKVAGMAVITALYFVWIIASDNLETGAHIAFICVYICTVLLLLLPRWEYIKSKAVFVILLCVAGIFSFIMAKTSHSEIGSAFQTLISLLPVLYAKDS